MCVKVWGILGNGQLKHKTVEGSMTSEKYCEMLEKWFPKAIDEYQFDRRHVSNENTKVNFFIPLCSLAVAFRIFI